jgi:hypothetical protein
VEKAAIKQCHDHCSMCYDSFLLTFASSVLIISHNCQCLASVLHVKSINPSAARPLPARSCRHELFSRVGSRVLKPPSLILPPSHSRPPLLTVDRPQLPSTFPTLPPFLQISSQKKVKKKKAKPTLQVCYWESTQQSSLLRNT